MAENYNTQDSAIDNSPESIDELNEELKEHNKTKPKTSKLKVFFIIILVILLAITGYRLYKAFTETEEMEKAADTNVKVMQAERGSISVTAPVSGKVAAKDTATVMVTLGGEVKELNVEVGDYVNKGAVLYTVDATSTQESYNQAQMGVETAKKNMDLIKTNLDRTQQLYDEGAVSLSDLQSLQTQYETAKIGYEQAQSAVKQAQSALDMASVKAPISGYVDSVGLTKGSYAMAGTQAVSITDLNTLRVKCDVSEYMISSIKQGDKVELYIKSATSDPIQGTVSNIGKSPASGTLTYPVEITFNNSGNLVKAGMFAQVQFTSAKKDNVIVIPSDAVMIKNGESVVAIINNNAAALRTVEPGIDNGVYVEIKDGLSEGEYVAVEGQNYVTDGEPVNIVG